jgi:hypothetical protein
VAWCALSYRDHFIEQLNREVARHFVGAVVPLSIPRNSYAQNIRLTFVGLSLQPKYEFRGTAMH